MITLDSLIPLAETLIPKIKDICEALTINDLCFLLASLSCFLEVNVRFSSLSAIINKRIWDGVVEKNWKRDGNPQHKSELDRRLRSICTKLDEGSVKAGIRMAVGDHNIVDFTVINNTALKLKHPPPCSVRDRTYIDCF